MKATKTKQARVLFVEDDSAFLEAITDLFSKWSRGKWEIHKASDSTQALELLGQQPFDLAVIDLGLPILDGEQLLTLIHRRHPYVRKAVLTCRADEDCRRRSLEAGAELFLEKPASEDGLHGIFVTLNELLSWQPEQGFQGVLRKVGLQDVIQMECLGRNSCVLEISGRRGAGRIFIDGGAIIHAEAGDRSGEDAFHFLMCLNSGEFSLKPYVAPPARTIQAQWEFLLMEAARKRDEQAETAQAPIEAPLDPSEDPVKLPRRIDEIFICDAEGGLIYEWQCPNVEVRSQLLRYLSHQATALAQAVPFGAFDRLEILGPQSRILTRVQSEWALLVRSSPIQPDARAQEGGLLRV